jgi:hypothetical protein
MNELHVCGYESVDVEDLRNYKVKSDI